MQLQDLHPGRAVRVAHAQAAADVLNRKSRIKYENFKIKMQIKYEKFLKFFNGRYELQKVVFEYAKIY